VSAVNRPRHGDRLRGVSPVELPMEGGCVGATVRLHVLATGHMLLSPRAVAFRDRPLGTVRASIPHLLRRGAAWTPVPVFLIEHPTAGAFLVDAGYDPSVARDPAETMGVVWGRIAFSHRMDAPPVRQQVRERGVDPDRIRAVIFTHLHVEHASGVGEFPSSTLLVDWREWRFATGPLARFDAYHPPAIRRGRRWALVDYDGPGAAPHGAFAQTLDLLGDGSIYLVSTAGHTAGHQSVVVRLRDREALVCGDAVPSARQLREPLMSEALDKRGFRRTLAQVHRYVAQEPAPLAIPGHDLGALTALAERYA
jgi:N-acyl homoserine lactone hydrolase